MTKVLIIDDEKDLVEIFIWSVQDMGFEAVGYTTVIDTDTLAPDFTHAFIDSMGGAGPVIAKKLKDKGIKVYSFSGLNKIDKRNEAFFDGQLNKPYDDSELAEILKR